MKNSLIKKTLLGFAASALLFTACESNNDLDQVDEPQESVDLAKAKAFAEEIGYNPDHISIGDFLLPDGTSEERIYIEDDIALSAEDFYALESINSIAKQYRTNNLVTGANRTIDILGFTGGGGQGLNSTQRTAMQFAVANYNRLSSVSLTFRLTFGTDFESADMVVFRNPNNSNTGGVAGFPSSDGRPNKFIQLFTGLDNLNANVNEHVITHEIGHSVGLRHSDFFSRQSCGQSGEAVGSNGAILIAGTPSGFDPSSLMNACFPLNTNGEFNGNDVTALQTIY